MSRICELAQENAKRHIYIRGTSVLGISLGLFLDSEGIGFDGFIDRDQTKQGSIIYNDYFCVDISEIPADSFVFVAVSSKRAEKEIVAELQKLEIDYADNLQDEIKECQKNEELFLKAFFIDRMKYVPDLKHPKTFNEKLQWLKLHDHNPLYATLADKYEVKDYVAKKIGSEHVIPAYGVWERFEDIDFDTLPDQFILKCTHDSGTFVIVTDKNNFDRQAAKETLERSLHVNYYDYCLEWVYKGVKPRIIAEKYIDTLGKPDSVEYKLSCFDGKVGYVTVCIGIAHDSFDKRTNDSYDLNFNHMPWYASYKNSGKDIQKPEQWDELIELSEILSAGIPHVRVDWYIIDGIIYFGEMTFYTWSGCADFTPPHWDLILGNYINLPETAD